MKDSNQKILWRICLFAPLLFLVVAYVFQFNGLYGQDGHEYLHLTNAINEFFKGGNFYQQSSFPLAYPFLAWVISRTGINEVFCLQFLSAFSFLVAIIYLKKLIEWIHGEAKNATLFIFLFFIFSPYIMRFSVLVMSDMMATALLLICIFHGLKYSAQFKTRDLLILNCTGIVAVETRYACFIPLTILFFYILFSHVDKKTPPSVFQILSAIVPNAVLLIADFLLRHVLLFWKLENGKFTLAYAVDRNSWTLTHFFQNHFQNADGAQQYSTWNIFQVWNNIWHPAFLFCGILFILFLRREDFTSPASRLMVAIVIIYASFIAGLPYQNNRYLLLTFPFVLVFLYPAFQRIVYHPKVISAGRTVKISLIALIFAAQIIFFVLSIQSIYQLNQTEQQIASSLKSFPGQTIYTASMTGALESYDVKNKIVDLMQSKIDSVDSNSLLLVNESYFVSHWTNQNPMIDLDWIRQHHQLTPVRNFQQGWSLYEIRP